MLGALLIMYYLVAAFQNGELCTAIILCICGGGEMDLAMRTLEQSIQYLHMICYLWLQCSNMQHQM